jgi:hypothetical protein
LGLTRDDKRYAVVKLQVRFASAHIAPRALGRDDCVSLFFGKKNTTRFVRVKLIFVKLVSGDSLPVFALSLDFLYGEA